MKKYAESIVEIVLIVIAVVFGYGVLNQRVDALEKSKQDSKEAIQRIEDNVIEIKQDVSFIKGKLERK